MPACGTETACLEGLWSNKAGPIASAQWQAAPTGPPAAAAASTPIPIPVASRSARSAPPRSLLDVLGRLLRKILGPILLAPAIWLSAWLWALRLVLRLPLHGLALVLHSTDRRRLPSRSRRCVLVSGAGTVQAVRLARNLARAGARVILCELEGRLGLARFSLSCARYYTLPKPTGAAAEYVRALRDIVAKERVDSYVPVSAAGTAYYDGLAKPYLEQLGCDCFVPGAAEVARLDDPLELLRRARALGLATPRHRVLETLEDAAALYENGTLSRPHYAMETGPAGLQEPRAELKLPATFGEFRRARERRPRDGRSWLVIREPGGVHFLTCTTVRDSRILANVTCRVEEAKGALIPENRPDIDRWVRRFLGGGGAFAGKVTGHLCFRLAEARPGELVAIGCRVGIGLPYLSQSSQHAKLLWRACGHSSVGPHLDETLQGKPLDMREALFLYWDPLPYCIYCHLQMPFGRLAEALGAQQHKPPLALVQ